MPLHDRRHVLDVLLVLLIIFIAAAGLEFGVVAKAIDVAHGTSIDRIALIPRIGISDPPAVGNEPGCSVADRDRHPKCRSLCRVSLAPSSFFNR